MAHNLATDGITNETAMFCVGNREAAWHHLGQRTDGAVAWEQAMKLAHLDWKVVLKDMFSRDLEGNVQKIEGYKAVWRENGNSLQLGVVGDGYTPIQNLQAFDFIDNLLEAQNGAHYESAGALGNGERIWVMARVPEADIQIAGTDDKSLSYLLVATSHDASLSYVARLTTVRVVCQNTLSVALQEAGNMFKVKHTKNAEARLLEAKTTMQGFAKDAKDLNDKLNTLATRKMTRDSMTDILNRIFPNGKKEDKQNTRRDNILADVLKLYEVNDNDAFPQLRGTAYNLLNAVTEWTDHLRGVRQTDSRKDMTDVQIRAENAMFGTGDKLKTEALEIILDATANNPSTTVTTYAPSAPQSGGLLDEIVNSQA